MDYDKVLDILIAGEALRALVDLHVTGGRNTKN